MNNKIDPIYTEVLGKLVEDEYEGGKNMDDISEKFDTKNMSELFDGMSDISSDIQIWDYSNRLNIILENANIENQEFQSHFVNRWGKGLDMSRGLRTICLDALKHTDSYPYESYMLKSLYQIFIRSCQVYYEIYVLISNGLVDGAWARWRTLYELGIIVQFIYEHGEEAAKEYYKSKQNRDEYYEWARKLSCYKGYKKHKNITFSSIYNRCEKIAPHWYNVYQTASVTIHGGAKGTFESYGGSENNTSGLGSDMYGIEEPATYAAETISII